MLEDWNHCKGNYYQLITIFFTYSYNLPNLHLGDVICDLRREAIKTILHAWDPLFLGGEGKGPGSFMLGRRLGKRL